VPASVLLYAFFIALLVAHARIGAAYEVEQSLFELLVQGGTGFAVASAAEWYAWLAAKLTLTPLLYANAQASQRGYLAAYNLMVGGVRLVSTRSVAAPCGLNGQFSRGRADGRMDGRPDGRPAGRPRAAMGRRGAPRQPPAPPPPELASPTLLLSQPR